MSGTIRVVPSPGGMRGGKTAAMLAFVRALQEAHRDRRVLWFKREANGLRPVEMLRESARN